jgi:hypothetical protein
VTEITGLSTASPKLYKSGQLASFGQLSRPKSYVLQKLTLAVFTLSGQLDETTEIMAQAAWKKSAFQLERALGNTLKRQGITIKDALPQTKN